MAETVADTRRLITKPQNLNDAYGPPSNFLEIDVSNPQTVGVGRGRFTTYEIRVKKPFPLALVAPTRTRSGPPRTATAAQARSPLAEADPGREPGSLFL
ncbi:Sorting nexin-3 [Saguinus oedipus]|uniref:Sorting nexin-3 n=1 Tax=Saguinus oedipus TaxID=9490 RepID=A0ABQ9VYG5_SAGOE|nr:Sorting nexin-3 [Saguinus oedipus]